MSGRLVLILKTNRVIPTSDTIRYAFQYSNVFNVIAGPILKDTIISIENVEMIGGIYNNNPSQGEQKTLWWNINKPTVGTDDNQVDYTIHGCAAVADTAYIVVP